MRSHNYFYTLTGMFPVIWHFFSETFIVKSAGSDHCGTGWSQTGKWMNPRCEIEGYRPAFFFILMKTEIGINGLSDAQKGATFFFNIWVFPSIRVLFDFYVRFYQLRWMFCHSLRLLQNNFYLTLNSISQVRILVLDELFTLNIIYLSSFKKTFCSYHG